MRLDYDAAFRTASQYAKKPPKDIVKKQKADALVEQTGVGQQSTFDRTCCGYIGHTCTRILTGVSVGWQVMYNMVNQEVMSKMSY